MLPSQKIPSVRNPDVGREAEPVRREIAQSKFTNTPTVEYNLLAKMMADAKAIAEKSNGEFKVGRLPRIAKNADAGAKGGDARQGKRKTVRDKVIEAIPSMKQPFQTKEIAKKINCNHHTVGCYLTELVALGDLRRSKREEGGFQGYEQVNLLNNKEECA